MAVLFSVYDVHVQDSGRIRNTCAHMDEWTGTGGGCDTTRGGPKGLKLMQLRQLFIEVGGVFGETSIQNPYNLCLRILGGEVGVMWSTVHVYSTYTLYYQGCC